METASGPAGQTYAGATVNFYPESASVTGMFYAGGRLYYTLSGQNGLFWRWFTPDSDLVGADRFSVAGATGFADAGGVFLAGGAGEHGGAGGSLYVVSRATGNLSVLGWLNGAPTGAPAVVSGPALDGVDWRVRVLFVGP